MRVSVLAFACAALLLSIGLQGQDQAPNRREFTITARDYRFAPDRIEVSRDDLVTITLHSADRPYSLAIDAYRIVKRAGAGQSVTFAFRADQAGSFPFYCNLTSDDGYRDMQGTLVVRAPGGR